MNDEEINEDAMVPPDFPMPSVPAIPPKEFKQVLKQYRRDVPSVGTVSYEDAVKLQDEGRICRGWTSVDGEKQYFHIIRSPTDFPNKSMLVGDTEQDLLLMTILLAEQAGIELDAMFSRDE